MQIERAKQLSREINMIPLINLVFLLLIFFLVAGSIEKFDIIALEVPVADSGKVLDEGHIVIVLGRYDEVILNDELVAKTDLKSLVAEQLKNNPRKIITLKADARLDAKKMIEVMNMLREAGGQNLSLVTQSLN